MPTKPRAPRKPRVRAAQPEEVETVDAEIVDEGPDSPGTELVVHEPMTLQAGVDGDTITVILLRGVVGYGQKDTVLTLVQGPTVDALITLGYMALYSGPIPPVSPVVAVSTGQQTLTLAQQQQVEANLHAGLAGIYAPVSRTGTKAVGQGELTLNLADFATPDGTDQTTGILAAITAAQTSRRRVFVPGSVAGFGFKGVVSIPNGVDVFGEGHSSSAVKSRFVALSADACIQFGATGTGTRGGVSGNFCVDGNSTATGNVLQFGRRVQGAFDPIWVTGQAGTGSGPANAAVLIQEMQNCIFRQLDIENCTGSGLVFDRGCGGILIELFEISNVGANGGWSVEFVQTAATPTLYPVPTDIQFTQGLTERPPNGAAGLINYAAGSDVIFDGAILQDSGTTARPLVKLSYDGTNLVARLRFRDCYLMNNATTPLGTVFDVGASCSLLLEGRNVVNGARYLFKLASGASVEDDGVILSNVAALLDPASTATVDAVVRRNTTFPTVIRRSSTSDHATVLVIGNQNATVTTTTSGGTTTVTQAAGGTAFTTSNVGGSITIPGAGASGGNLVTTIATVSTAGNSSCTTTVSATADVTSVPVTFGEPGARARMLADGSLHYGNGADFNYGTARIDSTGSAKFGNLSVAAGVGPSFGGGAGITALGAGTAPTSNPTGAVKGFLYIDSADSKLKFRGASGTITTIALP